MALNNTYFETKGRDITNPIPETPSYVPPIVPTPPTPSSGSTPVIPRPTFSGEVTVTLYNNSSDNNVLDKSITELSSKNIVVKDNMDLINPVLILEGDIECNYMHMLDRYYYVKCTAMPGGLTMLQGRSDVLMSFKSYIRSQSAILERNSSNVNTYLPDPEKKITAYKTSHAVSFSSGFSKTLNYYLLAIGN